MNCLLQFVLSKKIQSQKERRESRDLMNIVDDIGNINIVGDKKQAGEMNMPINTNEERKNTNKIETNVISNGKYNIRNKRGKQNKKKRQ